MVKTREMYSLANNEPGVNVEQVKINELYSFEGHPFKVKRDQELFELRRSIETETDKAAREREKLILKQLEKQYSLPDKESDYVA